MLMVDEKEEEQGNRENGSKVSRRAFLKTAAAAVAVAGAAAAAPGALMGASAPWAGAREGPEEVGDSSIVAYVRNAQDGEIVLMVGTREVTVRDHGLVSGLIRAAAGG